MPTPEGEVSPVDYYKFREFLRIPTDGHDFLHWWTDPIIRAQQLLHLPSWCGWGPLMNFQYGRCNKADKVWLDFVDAEPYWEDEGFFDHDYDPEDIG